MSRQRSRPLFPAGKLAPTPTGWLAVLLLALTTALGCDDGTSTERPVDVVGGNTRDAAPFVEAAVSTGLGFTHFNGMSGELYYSEMMGPGAALFDYDNDGDLDVYLVQGRMLKPGAELAEATFPPPPAMLPLRDRLYRNDLDVGHLSFTDVTAESGLEADGYGMGVAAGDYDNDGWIDLFVTQDGGDQLWRNLGDGTFRNVTLETGVEPPSGDPPWSLSAAWIDDDNDGWLDLFVVNYVDFTVADHRPCRMMSGQPDYCGPQAFNPLPDRLLRNLGPSAVGVTFEDAGGEAGIAAAASAGMGVGGGDFDGDGRLDLYVANDGMANFLWLGQGDGGFDDQALLSGTAFNREGQAEASMGVAVGDYDADGDDDLLLTHRALETHTLYRNDGGVFEDVTVASGLATPSWPATGFGVAWLDYDNDGWLDLLAVNGAVVLIPEQVAAGDPHPLGMADQLFHNLGTGATGDVRFAEVPSTTSEPLRSNVGRGLAVGDLDNDGYPDAVVANNAGAVELLLNRLGQDRHWLGLRLLGAQGRDMPGATAEVERRRPPRLWRRVPIGGSYLSSHDPRLLFGLGDDPEIGPVTVRWPDGACETFAVEIDRYTTLRQGDGRASDEGC